MFSGIMRKFADAEARSAARIIIYGNDYGDRDAVQRGALEQLELAYAASGKLSEWKAQRLKWETTPPWTWYPGGWRWFVWWCWERCKRCLVI